MRLFLLMMVHRSGAVSLVFANHFKEGHGNQPPRTRDERIARFVPVQVVLPADNVKEVSLAEGEFLRVPGFRLVIVERFDNLRAAQGCGQQRVAKDRLLD